jgi:probable regulatory domain-containing protein
MPEEIPLTPIGRDQIHKLETALLIGTLLSPEVIELLKSPEERLTWVDSLAAALAREKAHMTVPQIAEELGRSEVTIRNHLTRKTKAGQLVWQTYEKFAKEGVKIDVESLLGASSAELARLKGENEELRRKLEESQNRIEELSSLVEGLLKKINKVKDELRKVLEEL